MSKLECKVVEVKIESHPNADVLELARVGDYLSIVGKDQFKTGDKVVYIPEQSILPDGLIEELGLVGKLSGKEQNRVKAIKLRKILSQGLVYPAKAEWKIGQDVIEELGIIKWVPPVPIEMSGLVDNWDFTLNFDPENIKKFPDVIEEGEYVYYLEKIHGTFCSVTLAPEEKRKENMLNGKFAVSSKKYAHNGVYYQDIPENENNVYLKGVKNSGIAEKFEKMEATWIEVSKRLNQDPLYPLTIVGEVYGKVQDLRYGVEGDVAFRAFGICTNGRTYFSMPDFLSACKENGIETVPVLYEGPHSKEKMLEYTVGREQVSGRETCIREGLVVYPGLEREDELIGRVFLKSVSEKYLLRKGGTEFN